MKGLCLLSVGVMLGRLVNLVIGIVFIVQSVSVRAEITKKMWYRKGKLVSFLRREKIDTLRGMWLIQSRK